MSNVLDYEKQQQILALGRLGWTVSRIADATDVRRETATRYLRGAGLSVRGRGRPGEGAAKPAISGEVSTDPPAKPAISKPEVSTDSPPSRAPSASGCAPHREQIEAALKLGRNAMAIWQDLVEEGFTARYASVRRFVRQLRGRTPVEARVVITTAPGEEAQVDYGDGPMVRHPQTAKYRRTRLFVLTLGYSRKAVRLLVWHSSAQTWAELHERAFRRLGGTMRLVVLDNLKEGVLPPDVYDAALNPVYRDGPLPVEPFRYYRFGGRTVHLDGCVEVEAAYYSAPPGWIGQRVQVQWTDLHVRLLAPSTGQLLREHVRAPRGWHRIEDADRPARTPRPTLALLARAQHAGAHLHTVCAHIHDHDGAADDAAKAALELQVPTYRFLRRYLERHPPAPLTLRQVDPRIRQLTLYRDLIDRQTGDPA